MKIAHYAIVTPRLCGLYETTRELVANLRDQEIDSRIIDPKPLHKRIMDDDRGAKMADPSWWKEADILVSHSGLGEMEDCGKPIIHVAHGRPRHSFLNEQEGSTPVYSYLHALNTKPQFKAIVTFWPEHVPYLQVMCPDKPVHYVQSSCDLDHWKPKQSTYDFGGKKGGVNIICTDALRNDIDIYEPVNAYALWARQNKHLNPKLHIFGARNGLKAWPALLRRLELDGTLGLVQKWASDLSVVYNAADLLLTAHQIDVRSVRESMSCGCPIARITDITNFETIETGLNSSRDHIRFEAASRFDPKITAKQFREILCSF